MAASTAAATNNWRKSGRLKVRLPRLMREVGSHPGRLLLFVFGRWMPARHAVAGLLARARPAQAAVAAVPDEALAPLSPAAMVARLRQDGIVTGMRLPQELATPIRTHAETTICYGGLDWLQPFLPAEQPEVERRLGMSLPVGCVPEPERHCPAVAAVARNRWLRDIAGGYLGAEPQLLDVRLIWSFPSAKPTRAALGVAGQDSFHFDLDDWRQLKFFFYLQDVGEENGPHRYLRSTQRRRVLPHQFPLFSARPDAEVFRAYGRDMMQVLTGPAGTGFAQDPFGFHTGSSVRAGRRLVLEVSFGITRTMRQRDFGALG